MTLPTKFNVYECTLCGTWSVSDSRSRIPMVRQSECPNCRIQTDHKTYPAITHESVRRMLLERDRYRRGLLQIRDGTSGTIQQLRNFAGQVLSKKVERPIVVRKKPIRREDL